MSDRDILDAAQAAEYLQCSTKYIYDLAGLGKVPHFRVGRRLRFRRDDLLAWTAEQAR